jgi:hypothetical protein
VLVEVSGFGAPTHIEPWQARRMATALLSAAGLVEQARRRWLMTVEDESVYLSALGLRIWVLRKRRRVTQRQLGTSCGLPWSEIGYLEIGARAPNILTLRRVTAGLAVPLPMQVDESNDPFRPRRWAGSDSRPAPRRH